MGHCLAGASLPQPETEIGIFPALSGWSCSPPSPVPILGGWQGYGIACSMRAPAERRGHRWHGPTAGRGSPWTPRSLHAWMWVSPQRWTRYKTPGRASPRQLQPLLFLLLCGPTGDTLYGFIYYKRS